ncbi:MAG: hypothetical protein WHT06_14655 [Desulfobacterales bacterium]
MMRKIASALTGALRRLLAWAVVALAYALVIGGFVIYLPILLASMLLCRTGSEGAPKPPPERRKPF